MTSSTKRISRLLLASFMGASTVAFASDTTPQNDNAAPVPAPAAAPELKLVKPPAISIQLSPEEYNLIMINRAISNTHYDQQNALDKGKLLKDSISGRLAGLDPHSEIMGPKELDEFIKRMSGKTLGIGVEISQGEKFIVIIQPMEGSPAERAKLQPGDIITHADNFSLEGMSTSEAAEKISGEPGTNVTLRIIRDNVELAPITIKREEIKGVSLKFDKVGTVGLIKIRSFTKNIADEFKAAVNALEALPEPPLFYAIDLRDDPGGSLDGSADILDHVIDSDKPLITVRTRLSDPQKTVLPKTKNPMDGMTYLSTFGDLLKGKKLAVLINGGSASASELVSGTIQDFKRGRLYGSQTFGKGSVQIVEDLANNFKWGVNLPGWAMKLTYAQYFTPLQAVQGKGIMPDVLYKPLTEEKNKAVRKREADQAHSLATTRPDEKLRDPDQTCSPVSEDVKSDGYHPMLIDRMTKKLDLELICALDDLEATPSGLTVKAPYAKPAP